MAPRTARTPRIDALVICDDIRKEITNKDILVGVYGSDIVVGTFPATLSLSFWIEIAPVHVGELRFHLRILFAGKTRARIEAAMDVKKAVPSAVPISRISVQFPSEGVLRIDVSWNEGKKWNVAKRKSVIMGDVNNIFLTPPGQTSL